MAQEPPSGRPPDTTQILEEFEAARQEVTATAASQAAPTRPEGHPSESSSPGWTNHLDMVAQNHAANRMHEWANRPYAEHNASIQAKQTAQPPQDLCTDWAKQIAEAAKERADAAAQAKEQEKGKDGQGR
jgi:hypothetical protein